jgi:hypothetical protein
MRILEVSARVWPTAREPPKYEFWRVGMGKFLWSPKAKLCQSVSVDDGILRFEYLDGKVAEVVERTFPQGENREPAKISFTPIDKKFRRWVAKEIKAIFAETDTMEDAKRMLLLVVDEMLKAKRSAWMRLESDV